MLNGLLNALYRSAEICTYPTKTPLAILVFNGAVCQFLALQLQNLGTAHPRDILRSMPKRLIAPKFQNANLAGAWLGVTAVFFRSLSQQDRLKPLTALGLLASTIYCVQATVKEIYRSKNRTLSTCNSLGHRGISIGLGGLYMQGILVAMSLLSRRSA